MSDQTTPVPTRFIREYLLETANLQLAQWLAENAPPHINTLYYTIDWAWVYLDEAHPNDPAFLADAKEMLWAGVTALE